MEKSLTIINSLKMGNSEQISGLSIIFGHCIIQEELHQLHQLHLRCRVKNEK